MCSDDWTQFVAIKHGNRPQYFCSSCVSILKILIDIKTFGDWKEWEPIVSPEEIAKATEDYVNELRPVVATIRKVGFCSIREIAFSLNARGYVDLMGEDFNCKSVKSLLSLVDTTNLRK